MAYMGTGVSLRDSIHTDSSTGISGWNTHRTALTGEFTRNGGNISGRYGEFSKDIQEYNRKIDTLSGAWQDTGMFLTPYNAGFRYTGTGDFNKWDVYSVAFDGVDDYVTIGKSLVPAGGNVFTVSAWIYTNDQAAGYHEIMSQWSSAESGQSFFFGRNGDNIRFSDSWNNVDIGTWTAAAWHHLVGVSTATNAYIHLDGVLVATKGSALGYTGTDE